MISDLHYLCGSKEIFCPFTQKFPHRHELIYRLHYQLPDVRPGNLYTETTVLFQPCVLCQKMTIHKKIFFGSFPSLYLIPSSTRHRQTIPTPNLGKLVNLVYFQVAKSTYFGLVFWEVLVTSASAMVARTMGKISGGRVKYDGWGQV